jgi:flagellar basal-body rod modification protein FlgD
MTRVPSNLGTPAAQQRSAADAVNDIDLGTFLQLMITELQNQDPLNPLENKDMLAQISQIREVGATDKLTATLNSVLLGQSIASATNLIGAEVDGLSDDNQKITGIVKQVSIENGAPKLVVDSSLGAEPSIESGNVGKGEYSYRVVWAGEDGRLKGIELSGDDAVSTQGGNNYKSINLRNLPETPGPKQIYRTDSSGEGDYRLIATLTDGKQASYLDKASDAELSQTRQTSPFDKLSIIGRRYRLDLGSVGEIRVPKVAVGDDSETPETPETPDDGTTPPAEENEPA